MEVVFLLHLKTASGHTICILRALGPNFKKQNPHLSDHRPPVLHTTIFAHTKAGLSVNIAMRPAPSRDQMIKDSLHWSETLRASATSGCDDCMGFVTKLAGISQFKAVQTRTSTIIVNTCKELGVTFEGKQMAKHTVLSIQAIIPFTESMEFVQALASLMTLFKDVNKLTALGNVCKTTTTCIKGNFLNTELQEYRAIHTAATWALLNLRMAVMFGDLQAHSITNNSLVGASGGKDAGCIQAYFRKLQFIDYALAHFKTSTAYDPAVFENFMAYYTNPRKFVEKFTAKDFWTRTAEQMEQGKFTVGQVGIKHWNQRNFLEFLEEMPNRPTQALAELLHGLITTEYDQIILAQVRAGPDMAGDAETLAVLLRGEEGVDPNELNTQFRLYTAALSEVLVEINSQQPSAPRMPDLGGDTELDQARQEEKQAVFEKIRETLGRNIRFHSLPGNAAGALANFCNVVELNKILQGCPFHVNPTIGGTSPAKTTNKKGAKANRAFYLCADLFPGMLKGGPQDYRMGASYFHETPCPAGFKKLWEWVISVRKPNDMIVVFDGRFRQVRLWVEYQCLQLEQKHVMDEWIQYELPRRDFRYPKTQLAFSATNRETIIVYRPQNKRNTTSQPRANYNMCGEKSNHEMTHTGVKMRSLAELPKMTTKDKQQMMGTDFSIALTYPDAKRDIAAHGVPFSWCETKSVPWHANFMRAHEIDAVFDCAIGSGAAAMGAHYQNVQYDGIASNPHHAAWVQKLLDDTVFAFVADAGAGSDKEFINKVLQFFGTSVDAGFRFLKAPPDDKAESDDASKDGSEPELEEEFEA